MTLIHCMISSDCSKAADSVFICRYDWLERMPACAAHRIASNSTKRDGHESVRGREGAATLQNDAESGHEKRLEVHVAVRVGDLADVDVQRGVHGLLVEARALSN